MKTKKRTQPDIRTQRGSVFSNQVMFQVCSKKARAWVDENVQLEGWQWLGQSFAVDVRYADDLIQGMENSGLVVV